MAGKIDTMKRLRLFGDFLMLGSFLMLLWLFLSAYISNYKTTVDINNYGEAHVEMIILVFFLLPLFLITTALSYLDWKQTWKAKGQIAFSTYITKEPPREYMSYVEETLICPECYGGFTVRGPDAEGMITCPRCGTKGWYTPVDTTPSSPSDRDPKVKVIKRIGY